MSVQPLDSSQAALKQLWGAFVPPLSPDEIDLSVKLWQKINARKQLEQNPEGFFSKINDVVE